MGGLTKLMGIGFVLTFMTRGLGVVQASILKIDAFLTNIVSGTQKLTAFQAGVMKVVGGLVALKAGFAGLDIVKDAVDTFGEFETELLHIGAIQGINSDELQAFYDQATQLATKYPFPAAEIAEGMKTLSRAGFGANQVLQMMEPALQGAVIGGTGVAEATDSLTAATKAFNVPAEEAGYLIDQMAKGTTQAWLEMEDFSHAISRFGAPAMQANQEFSEMIAVLGTLTDTGLSATRSGTMMKMMLIKLRAPTSAATQALQELGVEVYNDQGKVRSLIDIIEDIDTATATLSQPTSRGWEDTADVLADLGDISEESAQKVRSLFGQRATVGYDVLTAAEQEFQGEIRSGTDLVRARAEEVAAARGFGEEYTAEVIESWENLQQVLKNVIQTIVIDIGSALAPVFKWVVKAATWVGGLVRSIVQNKLLATVLGVAVAVLSLIAIIGGFLAVLGGLATLFAGFASVLLSVFIPAGLMLLGKLFLLAAAIAAVVAIVYFAIKYWDEWSGAVWVAIKAVGSAFAWLWGFIKDHWRLLLGIVTLGLSWIIEFVVLVIKHWDYVKAAFMVSINWIVDTFNTGINAIESAWDTVCNFFVDSLNWVIRQINTLPLIKIPTLGETTEAVSSEQHTGGDFLARTVTSFAKGAYVVPETQLAVVHRGDEITQPDRYSYREGRSGERAAGPLVGEVNFYIQDGSNLSSTKLASMVEQALDEVESRRKGR